MEPNLNYKSFTNWYLKDRMYTNLIINAKNDEKYQIACNLQKLAQDIYKRKIELSNEGKWCIKCNHPKNKYCKTCKK